MLRPGWMQRYVPAELRDAARSILTAFGFIWRAEIEPDRVLDDLGREAMAAVTKRSHSDILPDPPLAPDAGFVTMPSAPFEASSAKSEASRRPSSGELLNFSSHQQPSFNALFTILA